MDVDLVNSLFEFGAVFFMLISIRQITKDKEVKGVSWSAACFFPVWSFWSAYYYSALEQTMSLLVGLGMSVAEAVYFGLVIYYSRKDARLRDKPITLPTITRPSASESEELQQ